jgi:hypothetical protein
MPGRSYIRFEKSVHGATGGAAPLRSLEGSLLPQGTEGAPNEESGGYGDAGSGWHGNCSGIFQ